MQKIQIGKIVSLKAQNTAVVEVVRKIVHPLYKKVMKRSKKYKAETEGKIYKLGDKVKIVSTKPISKEKFFKILEVIK